MQLSKTDNNIYVYFHINPLKNHVFYVGIGKNKRAYTDILPCLKAMGVLALRTYQYITLSSDSDDLADFNFI